MCESWRQTHRVLTVTASFLILLFKIMTMCFSSAQTWCFFRSAHILLHVNVRNDDVAAKKQQPCIS